VPARNTRQPHRARRVTIERAARTAVGVSKNEEQKQVLRLPKQDFDAPLASFVLSKNASKRNAKPRQAECTFRVRPMEIETRSLWMQTNLSQIIV
jgi:hypothetical protein